MYKAPYKIFGYIYLYMASKKKTNKINTDDSLSELLTYKLRITCKNETQKDFLNNLKDPSKLIVFGTGSAGTGKSYISLAYALKALKDKLFEKIIMVVPTAQATNKDMSFGFLKGELEDKTAPFKDVDRYTIEKILKQNNNENYKEIASKLMTKGLFEWEYINFMLGKSYDNALICICEAEQYTKEDMRLILTRLGENSRMIITGDETQTNRSSITTGHNVNGLTYSVNALKQMPEVAITTFSNSDIVRNPFITKILERFDTK